jgi:hypothetical protein
MKELKQFIKESLLDNENDLLNGDYISKKIATDVEIIQKALTKRKFVLGSKASPREYAVYVNQIDLMSNVLLRGAGYPDLPDDLDKIQIDHHNIVIEYSMDGVWFINIYYHIGDSETRYKRYSTRLDKLPCLSKSFSKLDDGVVISDIIKILKTQCKTSEGIMTLLREIRELA